MEYIHQYLVVELLTDCTNRSGHIRESAVRRLGNLGDPVAIIELINRLNDWVLQVRVAAFDAILKLMIPRNVEYFICCLPNIYHLKACARNNHEEMISMIEKFIISHENVDLLLAGVDNKNNFIARYSLALLLKNKLISHSILINRCLSHKDILIRLQVVGLLRDLVGDERKQALEVAILDHFMPIRREALQLLLKEQNHQLAEKFLFDHHAAIREVALRYCKNNLRDALSIYKANVSSNDYTIVRGALWGIEELNAYDCIESVRGFVSSQYVGVRRQAIKTLLKLDAENTKSILMCSLMDSSPSICKDAALFVKKNKIQLTGMDLLELIHAAKYNHTILVCLFISKQINKWERLVFLLRLLEAENAEKVPDGFVVSNEIVEWLDSFNRRSTQPTHQQLTILFDHSLNDIHEGVADQLLSVFRSYGLKRQTAITYI